MQRKENESFESYKTRRTASNIAVKAINRRARSIGGQSARQQLRQNRAGFSVGIKGMASSNFSVFGGGLAAARADANATTPRLLAHKAHVAKMTAKRAARAAI